jgi:hypothetical protein
MWTGHSEVARQGLGHVAQTSTASRVPSRIVTLMSRSSIIGRLRCSDP